MTADPPSALLDANVDVAARVERLDPGTRGGEPAEATRRTPVPPIRSVPLDAAGRPQHIFQLYSGTPSSPRPREVSL